MQTIPNGFDAFVARATVDGLLIHANRKTGKIVIDRAALRDTLRKNCRTPYAVTDATQSYFIAFRSRDCAIAECDSGALVPQSLPKGALNFSFCKVN